jgi:small subunit ribosomal protein S15
MPLTKDETIKIIAEHGKDANDTGSPEVQIALLTARITQLTDHFRTHKGDQHSKRGMFMLIGRRQRLQNYLANLDINRYRALMAKLGIRSKR